LDLEDLAEVEITSEDPAHPIESALLPGGTSGWRAAGPGEQTIQLLFAQPQAVHRISLEFSEPDVERTQEFVLRWSPDNGQSQPPADRADRHARGQCASCADTSVPRA
jgi:hypothetical protein